MLVFLIVLLFAQPASALEIEPRRAAIDLGERTRIQVRASGSKETRWQLQVAPFPYKQWTNEGPTRSLEQKEVLVRPSRNTRYRALLLDGDNQEQSKPRIIWVRPRSSLRTRWNRPYLYSRGWTEVDSYYEQFFGNLPKRQRRIYLYSRCSRGPWRLQSSSALRGVRLGSRFRIDWTLSRSLRCRGSISYWNIGMLLFPETLPSGDEGLGRPGLVRADIERATDLLGNRFIPPRDMKKYFGASS